jgi:hypothetical protein
LAQSERAAFDYSLRVFLDIARPKALQFAHYEPDIPSVLFAGDIALVQHVYDAERDVLLRYHSFWKSLFLPEEEPQT